MAPYPLLDAPAPFGYMHLPSAPIEPSAPPAYTPYNDTSKDDELDELDLLKKKNKELEQKKVQCLQTEVENSVLRRDFKNMKMYNDDLENQLSTCNTYDLSTYLRYIPIAVLILLFIPQLRRGSKVRRLFTQSRIKRSTKKKGSKTSTKKSSKKSSKKRRRLTTPKTYMGLWKTPPKPLGSMTRYEIIKELRSFRDAWERITQRNTDLDDVRLKDESTSDLRNLLKHFYTDESKKQAEVYIRRMGF